MGTILTFALSQFILLPILIGLFRIKTLKQEYLPFYVLLLLGFITELISFVLIQQYHAHNAISTNLYVLCEWLLLTYQFKIWGFLRKKRRLFDLLVGIPVLVWIIENLVFWNIIVFGPYFRMLYSFLIVLMSITEINFKIIHDNKNLLRNPRFIICVGLILFFVYQILYEWAYQLSVIGASDFSARITALFAYMNAITNIIFGIAFLLIPAPNKFKLEQ